MGIEHKIPVRGRRHRGDERMPSHANHRFDNYVECIQKCTAYHRYTYPHNASTPRVALTTLKRPTTHSLHSKGPLRKTT
jgi:hypothetical protein